jgi:hypothetical protein
MPPTETLTLPREIVDRALALGERDVAATEALSAKLDELRPIVEAYGQALKARETARAEADAERLESRSTVAKLSTSRPAIAAYTAILVLLANYLTGLAGVAPPAIRAALAPEVIDATP